MKQVELEATQLHWLEGNDPFADCCLHGGVYLKIGDVLLSDGKDSDWTVSTSAFNLLKTINQDHKIGSGRPLIPHCGQTMWLLESEPDGLYLGGCDLGIDWEVRHQGNTVIHRFFNGQTAEVSPHNWRSAVCAFSDKVHEFFMTAWPKNIKDQEDRKGFELFMNLWKQLRYKAFD
jgi:hypothetical protein